MEGIGVVLARGEAAHGYGRGNGGGAFAHEVVGGGGEVLGGVAGHGGGREATLVALTPEVEGAFAPHRGGEADGKDHFGGGIVEVDAHAVHVQAHTPVLFEVVAVGTRADVGTALPEGGVHGQEFALREDVGAEFEAHGAVGRLPPEGEFGIGIDAVFAGFGAGETHVARLSGLEGGAHVQVVDALIAHGGDDDAPGAGEGGEGAIVGRGAVVRTDLRAEAQVGDPGHVAPAGETADEAHVFDHLGALEGGGDEEERGAGGDAVEVVAHFAAGGDGRHVRAVAAALQIDVVGAVDDGGAVDRQRTVARGGVAAAVPEGDDAAAALPVEEGGVAIFETAVDDADDHAAAVEGRVELGAGLHAVDVGGAAGFVEQRGEGAARREALHTGVGGEAAQRGGVGREGHEAFGAHAGLSRGVVGREAVGGKGGLDVDGGAERVGRGVGTGAEGVRGVGEEETVEGGVGLGQGEGVDAGGDCGGRGETGGAGLGVGLGRCGEGGGEKEGEQEHNSGAVA